MSDILTQQRRKAQNLDAAIEAIREAKPDTDRMDEALGEAFIPDEDKLTAIVAELAEAFARQERAFGHLTDHVAADLTKRVEQLEKSEAPPKARKDSGKK
jgi:nucleoid-associated protein YejK